MPAGIYTRTTGHREISRQIGRKTGAKNLAAYLNSEKCREVARENGRKTGAKNIAAYNNSEKCKEDARQNISKKRLMITTENQKALSKALTNNGIHNHMEHYFPTIHRLGDIAIPSSKLIIEVDGSSHEGMFCTKEEKQADDKLKDEQIRSLGWNVIRVTNKEVENNMDGVIIKIMSA